MVSKSLRISEGKITLLVPVSNNPSYSILILFNVSFPFLTPNEYNSHVHNLES